MNDKYTFRHGRSEEDPSKLKAFFNKIFHPEKVGDLTEILYRHHPFMNDRCWYIAEDKETKEIAAAFTLIPWEWEYQGIKLKVAEQGIVGTADDHRKQGLMVDLNKKFDETLLKEGYHIAGIEGIPGFYQNFGYRYSIPLENHINLELHSIKSRELDFRVQQATKMDIPFLKEQDKHYRQANQISSIRNDGVWDYLFDHSPNTEYGMEYYILQRGEEKYHIKISLDGFGDGLIISEVSENISYDGFADLLVFAKELAEKRSKPYLRFNLSTESRAAKMLEAHGARNSEFWGWQIKIPDPLLFLQTIQPVLKKRLAASAFANIKAMFRMDLCHMGIDFIWDGTNLEIKKAHGGTEVKDCYTMSREIFPAYILGALSDEDFKSVRPDIRYTTAKAKLMADALFPKKPSWIYHEY